MTHDHEDLSRRLAALVIETPSWGYGDSGTRFATFQQPGRPRDVYERLDDAAEVHRLTGTAPAVAMHFPWDVVDDYGDCAATWRASACRWARSIPTCFRTPTTSSARSPIRMTACGRRRSSTSPSASRSPSALGSSAQSLWFADGTNYPGQDDLRARRERMIACLNELYGALPAEQELLLEYKLFEPAFYAADLADWGSSLLVCQKLGDRARVLVDLGHHAQGVNVEQIVAILAAEGRLGGFHFNNRKYADDDLIVGSVNPFELFLIFCELGAGGELPRLTIDQAHNVEPKVEAMVLSVVNIQEAYAKALLVDRAALAEAQAEGDVLRGHELLLEAFGTDVRPLCAKVRAGLGAAENPIAELRASGFAERRAAERGSDAGVAGGWGR